MLWILLAVVTLVVLVTLLIFRVKDLSEYDGQDWVMKEVAPNPAHDEVIERIKDMGRASRGLKGKARLIALRNHLDSLGEGVDIESDIRHQDHPRGEWILAPGADSRRRVLYIHGGAWAAGSPRSHRAITDRFSRIANAAVFAVDYRLMPEHRFMDGIRDCRQAYSWLLNHGPDGEAPVDFMVVAGDSAGGSHTLSLLAWIRDNGLRQADAAVALSPSTDLTLTAPSNRENIRTDPLLGPVFGGLSKIPLPVLWWGTLAAFRISPTNPVASPLRGELNKLPPVLIHASTTEMLLDNATRYAAKAKAQGSPVELHTWQNMVHVWHIFTPLLPEADEAFDDIAAFLKKVEQP
ncbi:alpha/beta hydrolase [Marinobacter nauticus]|uniref:alpha/beta hydrolase n=1 Tax=Marinobacter nauticus TaxID=2743 RepID=UPI000EB025B0|nr:alpha/beta hydrolase [Marinobacter nauticus]MBW3198657.1 alpha/beta hydrolase [Marinobacter nauticus]MBY6184067.1 alpha/beta hydrolase [Marinobacter nauticus]RKR71561.1 acetyl esterase/lipase [Marinobacter nauticus]